MLPQNLRSVTEYLKGIDMPASKDEIVQKARENNAPDGVIRVLDQIPDKMYQGMDEIWAAIGSKI